MRVLYNKEGETAGLHTSKKSLEWVWHGSALSMRAGAATWTVSGPVAASTDDGGDMSLKERGLWLFHLLDRMFTRRQACGSTVARRWPQHARGVEAACYTSPQQDGGGLVAWRRRRRRHNACDGRTSFFPATPTRLTFVESLINLPGRPAAGVRLT